MLESVREALQARGCSLALLLGMDLTGGLRRDVAVWSPDIDRTLQVSMTDGTVNTTIQFN